ncbi:MAG: hypothetical protein ACHP7N_01110 [Caulobacterales bacterium]
MAQSSTTTAANVGQVFAVGDAIVYPYPTAPLAMRITSVVADANGATTVAWSQASGLTALAKGSVVAIPNTVIGANQSVIMADVKYTYTSGLNYLLPQPITFNQVYYLRPRLSTQVTCADC